MKTTRISETIIVVRVASLNDDFSILSVNMFMFIIPITFRN